MAALAWEVVAWVLVEAVWVSLLAFPWAFLPSWVSLLWVFLEAAA